MASAMVREVPYPWQWRHAREITDYHDRETEASCVDERQATTQADETSGESQRGAQRMRRPGAARRSAVLEARGTPQRTALGGARENTYIS